VLDYDQKGVTASLRLSPHYYNTEDEVDRSVSVIQELMMQSA
jgi:selenocysteine lyase/cysteine desulfurase